MKKLLLSLLMALIIPSVMVSAANVGDTYLKVNTTDELTIGDEYILCYQTNAMGAQYGTTFRVRVANGVTINGDEATIASADVVPFTIVEGTATGTYAFKFTDKYLQCTNIKNGNVSEYETLVANCNLSISIANGTATIIPIEHSNNNSCKIQYNSNSGQERFTNYKTGTQKDCTLYKLASSTPAEVEAFTTEPTAVNDEISVVKGSEVTFTAKNAAQIKYTIDEQPQETVDGEFVTLSFSEAAIVTLEAYDTEGVKKQDAMYMINIVAAPECGEVVFNPADGSAVDSGTNVIISCENAVKIVYQIGEAEAVTVDGSEATVKVTEACTITAHGVNADGKESAVATASYTIKERPAEGSVMFDFTSPDMLAAASKEVTPGNGTSKTGPNSLIGVSFTVDGFTIAFDEGTTADGGVPTNGPRYWEKTDVIRHIRIYTDNTITITAPAGSVINSLSFTQNEDGTAWHEPTVAPAGTWDGKVWTRTEAPANSMMRAQNDNGNTVVMTMTGQVNFATVEVKYAAEDTSGIESVTVEDSDAPVEYFNLQGVRVDNPSAGLYIRRQGTSVSKVYIR